MEMDLPTRGAALWTCARFMKFPALPSALALGLTLIFSACNKPTASKEVIFGAIHENVHALEKKDIETVMATIHPDSPAFANTRAAVEEMFRSVDLKYTLSELRIESANPEEVKVSFKQQTEKTSERGRFENNIVEGIHTLRPDKKTWKIFRTLETKITNLQGKPLFASPAPPPASPIPPVDRLPAEKSLLESAPLKTAPAPEAPAPAPATPPAK